jgi:geranylgeranyl pyrophosphate synthase
MKTEEEKLLKEAIDILYESGSIQYAEKRAKDLMENAWNEL